MENILEQLDKLSPEAQDSLMSDALSIAKANADKKLDKFRQFQKKYRNDPVGFARDCIRWKEVESGLTDYQIEIVEDFNEGVKITIRGPRGLGKTMLVAILTLWWALVHDGLDWQVAQSASVFRQLEDVLWPEIHKWARRLKWEVIGREPFNKRTELMKAKLVLSTGMAFPISSDNPSATEGVHADYLLYIFDESKIIEAAFWDSVEGALNNDQQVYKWIAISTPGDMSTRFYQIHARKPGYEDWKTRHVTIDEVIAAGRTTKEWVEQRKRQWGENSQLFYNHVLGEFKESDEDAIIPLAWLEAAMIRGDDWRDAVSKGSPLGQLTLLGVDIGLGGSSGDSTVYAPIYDDCHVGDLKLESRGGATDILMKVTGTIKGFIDAHNCTAFIDVINLGSGIVSRLHEQGLQTKAKPFNASKKPPRRVKEKTGQFKFSNNRSAMWWLAREMFEPESEYLISLPRDDDLIGELTAPTWKLMSNATIQVEGKKDIRKRLGRSTDRADAVLQALAGKKLTTGGNSEVHIVGQGRIF